MREVESAHCGVREGGGGLGFADGRNVLVKLMSCVLRRLDEGGEDVNEERSVSAEGISDMRQ